MEGSEIAKRDHQRNKSEIVKLVKEMFNQEKWGDEEYKKKLQELVVKDEKLVKDVIEKIKLEKGLAQYHNYQKSKSTVLILYVMQYAGLENE